MYRVLSGQKYRLAGGDACYNAIYSSFKLLESWADAGEIDLIEQTINLCKPLVLNNATSIQALINGVSLPLIELNGISRIEQNRQICDYILDTELHRSPLQGVARVSEFYFGGCIFGEFADAIHQVGRLEWPDPEVHNTRPFYYQMCNEFGWFWTSAPNDPFGSKVTVDYWASLCTAAFGKLYTAQSLEENARRVRLRYGGIANANFTNVYTSQGEFDPWRYLGLNQDLNPSSPTYVIPGKLLGKFQ